MTQQASPLVSVIIPCFNGEAFIADAIQSALDQTYSQTEIIVIDDGSTDKSLDVIRSFAPRIKWETGPNRGGSAARNRGLALAEGQLIQFLDADDILFPEKIRKQLDYLNTHPADIVFCDLEVVDDASASPRRVKRPPFPEHDPLPFLLFHQLHTITAIHSKRVLMAVEGFDASLPCAQEYDLHLRLACQGASFVHYPEVLTQVRRRPGSVSSNYVRVLNQCSKILWRAYEMLKVRGTLSPERMQAFAEMMAWSARQLLREHQTERGIAYFREALKMHPGGGLGACSFPVRTLHRLMGPALACRIMQAGRRK